MMDATGSADRRIAGYDFGTSASARSPVTFEELSHVEQTVGWTRKTSSCCASMRSCFARRRRRWSARGAR